MSAKDHKEIAEKILKAETTRKHAEDVKKRITDVDHLFNHFEQLISVASNQGKFAIEKQTFAADRFRSSTIDEVVDRLKDDGYNVHVSGNNALHQVVFTISW